MLRKVWKVPGSRTRSCYQRSSSAGAEQQLAAGRAGSRRCLYVLSSCRTDSTKGTSARSARPLPTWLHARNRKTVPGPCRDLHGRLHRGRIKRKCENI
jgi:hypothetical protein